jgi:hypothetical protein
MIQLRRSRAKSRIHKQFTGDKLVEKLMLLAQARIDNGDDIVFERALGDWKKNKPQLKKDTAGKCAYCEADAESVSYGDVEHFRPKSVYWWLGLCVDNYVFACQLCNQDHKGVKFPIAGVRLQEPAMPGLIPGNLAVRQQLAAQICPDPATTSDAILEALWGGEDADLPHPYLEDPEKLFAWVAVETNEEVWVEVADPSNARAVRAFKAADDCLGINREPLRIRRFTIFANIRDHLENWQQGNGVVKQRAVAGVVRMCRDKEVFAGMCRYFARSAGFPI